MEASNVMELVAAARWILGGLWIVAGVVVVVTLKGQSRNLLAILAYAFYLAMATSFLVDGVAFVAADELAAGIVAIAVSQVGAVAATIWFLRRHSSPDGSEDDDESEFSLPYLRAVERRADRLTQAYRGHDPQVGTLMRRLCLEASELPGAVEQIHFTVTKRGDALVPTEYVTLAGRRQRVDRTSLQGAALMLTARKLRAVGANPWNLPGLVKTPGRRRRMTLTVV